jgi:hypothetical protein
LERRPGITYLKWPERGWLLIGAWLDRRKLFGGVVIALVLLLLSDFVPASNRFWARHPISAGLLISALLVMVAVAGLDEVVARREARRWRPLALMVVDQLRCRVGSLELTLETRTLTYCSRTYGTFEVPEDREFDGVLLEALRDPQTWASEEDEPELLEELEGQIERLENDLQRWAPVMVADSRLSEIAALGTRIRDLQRVAAQSLEFVCVEQFTDLSAPLEFAVRNRFRFMEALIVYRSTASKFRELAEEFRGPVEGIAIFSDSDVESVTDAIESALRGRS